MTCHSPTIYASIVMLAPGASLKLDNEADERAVYLLDGDVSVGGTALEPQTSCLLAPGHEPVLQTKEGARLMLCGGAPMDGERHVWWNFVSSQPRPHQRSQARDGRPASSPSRPTTMTNSSRFPKCR